MSKLIASRTAQNVKEAEFTFSFDDTMLTTTGVEVDFGKVDIAAASFAIINLPMDAVVLGGEVVTDTAFDTAGYDITVGDGAVGNRYLASTDAKGAGRVALVPTGFRTTGGPIVLSRVSDDVCTAGKMTVRVQYIQTGQGDYVNV